MAKFRATRLAMKTLRELLAVHVERATAKETTRGPLPSKQRYPHALRNILSFVGLWNLEHGILTLHGPALDLPTAAPGLLASVAGGVVYEECRHAQLVLLSIYLGRGGFRFAKKNWRGLQKLDVCSKLLS